MRLRLSFRDVQMRWLIQQHLQKEQTWAGRVRRSRGSDRDRRDPVGAALMEAETGAELQPSWSVETAGGF